MTGERPGFGRLEHALAAGARRTDQILCDAWQADASSGVADDVERYTPADLEAFTLETKDAARLYGADLVGVATLDSAWLRGSPEGAFDPTRHTTVVVMAVAMDYRGILESPTMRASAATSAGYSQMAVVGTGVMTFLRALGYEAIAAGNEIALSVPLAVAAGLGEVGRTGQLITQRFGPRVRLCKVFTDAPLVSDSPMTFGVAEFCQTCRACIDACEGDAIPEGSPDDTTGRWAIDGSRCRDFWRVNGASCANCLAMCPYNIPPTD
jgi:epoxyqueuosine reductase